MKSLPAYFYLIVFLIGGLITRECVTGSLQKPEKAYTTWLEGATAPNPIPKITLITADTAGQLSSLDVALFLRAAVQFKAEVAAIAASDLAVGDEDLLKSVLSRESGTAIVAGVWLTDAAGGTANLVEVNWPNADSLPSFLGARNNVPASAETTFGFLNLPANENADSVPVLARLDQRTVASFSLACFTSYLARDGIALRAPQSGNTLVFSNQIRLKLEPNGTIKLEPEAYSQIKRFSLGDLLVAAEKSEGTGGGNPAVIEAIRDHLVVLSPAPNAAELAAGTFTIGQIQALAIASLVNQVHRLSLGIWIWWVPFLWFFPWLKISERWSVGIQFSAVVMGAAFYGLFSGAIAQEFGLFLPGIPALAWFAAILGVIFVRRKSESA